MDFSFGVYINSTDNLPHFMFDGSMNLTSQCIQEADSVMDSYYVEGTRSLTAYGRCIFFVDVIVVSFLCLFGFVGNGLSIAVLRRDHDKKNATNWLLQTLAVLDTLYLVSCVFIQPLRTVCQMTNWVTELRAAFPYMETYVWAAASITQTATIWMLVIVTGDRFAAVCRPLKADLRSIQRARIAVGLVLVVSVLYNLPLFFEREVVMRRCRNVSYASSVKSALRSNYHYFFVYKTILYFVFRTFGPLIILTVLNVRLIAALRVVRQRRKTLQKRRGTAKNHRENITLMLVVVVSAFIVCEIPDLGLRVTVTLMEVYSEFNMLYERHHKVIQLVNTLTNMLLTLNSSFNFVVYCLVGKKFRGILRRMCHCSSAEDGPAVPVPSETEPLTNIRINASHNIHTIVMTNV